ncbi:Citrate synthase 1 [compost metagenome]
MAMVTGLEGIVAAETELSLVDGEKGHLVYRGYWAKDLALTKSFEEVAYLLWYGVLPNEEELTLLSTRWKAAQNLPVYIQELMDKLPPEMDMMSVIRTSISAMGNQPDHWPPTKEAALDFTALVPVIIAYRYRAQQGHSFIEPHLGLNHVANYLYMLTGKIPQSAHVQALSAYFILAMEHGMNASTFAGRVILSTQSDMASALCGSIGAMKGPLHGGAPSEVIHMLDEIGSKENAEGWLREQLENGKRLMGFGHRIYKTRDPRAEALQLVTQQLSGEDPWFELASYVEAEAIRLLELYKPGRKLYTNVEFFAAAVLRAVALPPELFTSSFTAARIVGWTAHLLEQAECNRIFRPQSKYVGEMPKAEMNAL